MKKGIIQKDKLWILTAPVHSGKTTLLTKWLEGKDTGGFLTPDRDNVRYFYDIIQQTYLPFEVPFDTNAEQTSVGKYTFLNSTLEYGNQLIINSLFENHTYFIIDEYGKLELDGKGFSEGVDKLMSEYKHLTNKTTYIIIVRDYLYEAFLERYNLPVTGIAMEEF